MENNAYVIGRNGNFTKGFYKALDKWFKDDRVNGYQRLWLEDTSNEEEFREDWDEHYLLIQKELVARGFTDSSIILVDNTW